MLWNVARSIQIFQTGNFFPTKKINLNHFLYLTVDLCCLLGPFILSFHPRLHLYRKWKSIFVGILAMMLVFIPWDVYFTLNNIWHFSNEYTIGIRIWNLPIEEWLFFFCVPYACIFTFEVIVSYFPNKPKYILTSIISFILIITSIFLSITHFHHWYTFSATITAAILIVYHTWKRTEYLGHFYLAWGILQLPFFISNGILTGLKFWNFPIINQTQISIQDAIVYYNNLHNLGIRIWTVPVDDFFYGLVMVLLVLTAYKWHESTAHQR